VDFTRLRLTRSSRCAGLPGLGVVEEGFEDSGLESLFEFEQEFHAGEVDALS